MLNDVPTSNEAREDLIMSSPPALEYTASTPGLTTLDYAPIPPEPIIPTQIQQSYNGWVNTNSSTVDEGAQIYFEVPATIERKDSAMPDSNEAPSPMTLMDSAMTEELKWKKRMNEIEADAEARRTSSDMGSGIVHPNGLWKFSAVVKR